MNRTRNLERRDVDANAIARACVSIQNDLTIAQFYGKTEEYVAEIRAKLPKPRTLSLKWSNEPKHPIRINDGAVREAATKACDALNERIWRMYEGMARDRGLVDVYEAAALCGMVPS